MPEFRNFTPHIINLNSGAAFEPEGLARVNASFSSFDENGVCIQEFGEVTGLPAPKDGVFLIVSGLVLSAVKSKGRSDCVAPATGHPAVVRNDKGHIVSVPGFVR